MVAFCGYGDQKLSISSREGATLHEIALPFNPRCLTASITTVAVGGNASVFLVGVEAGSITATLPIPSLPCCLAFGDQGKKLGCGLRHGLLIFLDPSSNLALN